MQKNVEYWKITCYIIIENKFTLMKINKLKWGNDEIYV